MKHKIEQLLAVARSMSDPCEELLETAEGAGVIAAMAYERCVKPDQDGAEFWHNFWAGYNAAQAILTKTYEQEEDKS